MVRDVKQCRKCKRIVAFSKKHDLSIAPKKFTVKVLNKWIVGDPQKAEIDVFRESQQILAKYQPPPHLRLPLLVAAKGNPSVLAWLMYPTRTVQGHTS